VNTELQTGAKPAGTGRWRWLWVVLIFSLALNLLFVGLVAGNWWMHGGPRNARYHVLTGAVEKLMQDLPDAKRKQAAELLEQHRQNVSTLRQQLRDTRKSAKDAVLTEPYDEEKVAAALSRFREIRTGQHQSMHTMMLGLMKNLSLEERKQLLAHIRAGFRQRGGRWRRSGDSRDASPARRQ
jgi:uncharacterized membrane protein